MTKTSDCKDAFLALLRDGLWKDYESVSGEWLAVSKAEVLRLAEEQSVLGLVTAGLEKLPSDVFPLTEKLAFLGKCQLIEQRNEAMNQFIAGLVVQLNKNGIYVLLVKGQGIAQYYKKPLWRTSGDIDFFFDIDDFYLAKSFFDNCSGQIGKEHLKNKNQLHISYQLNGWTVELHGTMHTNLSKKIDKVIDSVQEVTFRNHEVSVWQNDKTGVLIPYADNHLIFIFTHFLKHFFQGGIGLRQICDWCRLLWVCKDVIDKDLLYVRLSRMSLLSEWKTFGYFAVNYLGLPSEAMPFYEECYRKRSEKVLSYILETGSFGHNKDISYQRKQKGVLRKVTTFSRQVKDSCRLACIFPKDAPLFLCRYFVNGIRVAFVK